MTLVLAIVIPTTLALIYKSEIKQAKFDYQNKRYFREWVHVDLDQLPQFENNFKLFMMQTGTMFLQHLGW